MPRACAARLLLLACIAGASSLTTACGSSESHPAAPPDTTHVDTTPPPSQRATVRVTVALSAVDSSVARALALPADRRLAGATVILQRTGSASQLSATTDSQGIATFTDVLVGSYQASVTRTLSAAERTQLASSDADVTALGGGNSFTVQSPTTNASLIIDAGRRGSLVISEINPTQPATGTGEFYSYAHYLELYNNSDSTLYLDGLTVGIGLPGWVDDPPAPCSQQQPLRVDSLGIWAAYFYRFPGAGRSYPLPPGQLVLLPPMRSITPPSTLRSLIFRRPISSSAAAATWIIRGSPTWSASGRRPVECPRGMA